jgi:hypothetical protein
MPSQLVSSMITDQLFNLRNLKLNYKIVLIAIASLLLFLLFLTQKEIFILLVVTSFSIALSFIIGSFGPLKLFGIEFVTFSTILAGNLLGSFVGAIYGLSMLIIHIFAARYSGGPYILWTVPSYVIIGILSGILTNPMFLVGMIVIIDLFDILMTTSFYRENSAKTIIFCIGNAIFNAFLILNLLKFFTGLV